MRRETKCEMEMEMKMETRKRATLTNGGKTLNYDA